MTEPVAAAEALASELLLLLDALPAALRRDAGNSQPGPRATEASIPVNQDVAEVMRVLPRQVAAEDRRIRTALGFSKISQGTPDVISRWPSYVRALQACTTAGDYSTDTAITAITRWLKAVRRALGLSMRAQPLGIHTCPYSCPEGQLLVLGSEGSLRRQGTGWGVDWRHAERILCPACGTSWGQAEWPLLGKLLNAVTRTEADPVALGIMLGIPAATIRRWAFEKRITTTGHDARGRTLYATDDVRAVAVDLGRLAALPCGKFAITGRVVNTHQQWEQSCSREAARHHARPLFACPHRTGQRDATSHGHRAYRGAGVVNGNPVTGAERLRIRVGYEQRLSAREIGRQINRPAQTVVRVARGMGLHFDHEQTKAATAARSAAAAERRALIAERLLGEALQMLDELHLPYQDHNFGGVQNTLVTGTVMPTPTDKVQRTRAVASLMGEYRKLAEMSAGEPTEGARSLIGGLAKAFAAAADNLPSGDDDSDTA